MLLGNHLQGKIEFLWLIKLFQKVFMGNVVGGYFYQKVWDKSVELNKVYSMISVKFEDFAMICGDHHKWTIYLWSRSNV